MFELLQGENLNIIGTSGAGKTVQGKRIAVRLGVPFYDNDREVERITGFDIKAIFAVHGEAGFRKFETERLLHATKVGGMVVSTGAGIVTVPQNNELLRAGPVLWIDVALDVVVARLSKKSDRPLAATREDIEKRYYQRRELYESFAISGFHVRIDRELEKDEVTKRIFAELGLD